MTEAVLFATAVPGGTGLPATLAAQLRQAGARDVFVLAGADPAQDLRAAAGAATDCAARGERLLLCAGDLVGHDAVLWHLATDPAGRSIALTGAATAAPQAPAVRVARSRVAGVLPPGAGETAFLGALLIVPADLPALIIAAERAADRLAREAAPAPVADIIAAERAADRLAREAAPAPVADPPGPPAGGGAIDALLPELLDAGVALGAQRVRLVHAERVTDAGALAAARAAVAAVDEDAARLRLAVKERDDLFTTYLVSPWSPLVTRAAARLGLTPSGVTAISVVVVALAGLCFWQAGRAAMIAGAVLLYLGFVLDCVDGQLARYTRRFSAAGGWLDTMADRAKEYGVYAALAAGAERAGLGSAWPLAVAAIVLQTVRHMTDAWYGAMHDRAATGPGGPALGGRLGAVSERVQADTGSPIYWLKRTVVFPIGERWALIALVAAVSTGRVALIAVLTWGALALGYTLALRGLRARSMRVAVLGGVEAADHRDDGPLVRLLNRGPTAPAGLDWLVPAALRAVECLAAVAVAFVAGVPYPLLFLLLLVLVLHHYDLVARMEKGLPIARSGAALGWDGRILVLAVAALLPGAAPALVTALAGYVGGVLVIRAAVGFAATRPAPVPVPEGDNR